MHMERGREGCFLFLVGEVAFFFFFFPSLQVKETVVFTMPGRAGRQSYGTARDVHYIKCFCFRLVDKKFCFQFRLKAKRERRRRILFFLLFHVGRPGVLWLTEKAAVLWYPIQHRDAPLATQIWIYQGQPPVCMWVLGRGYSFHPPMAISSSNHINKSCPINNIR